MNAAKTPGMPFRVANGTFEPPFQSIMTVNPGSISFVNKVMRPYRFNNDNGKSVDFFTLVKKAINDIYGR
jgi:hypothetical protein